MQAIRKFLMGIKNPAAIPSAVKQSVNRYIPHNVGIQGSYRTGNIGDRALGEIFKSNLETDGYRTYLFDKNVQQSNAPNRILGGGGVLHDWYGTEHLRKRLNYVTSGERGFIIGVGAPGFHSEKACSLISEMLPQMEIITVRDERAKNNIQRVCDVDVTVTACPVFLYDDPALEPTEQTGVNFRPYFDEKEDLSDEILKDYFGYEDLEDATQKYITTAQRICDKLDNPLFIPFHNDDEAFARKHLDIPVFEHKISVSRTLKKVSQMKRMVTTRYHSLIFAAICDKPVLPLAYEPKVEAVADRLDLPWYKPHKDVPFEFTPVSNVDTIRSAAQQNMKLLSDRLQ
ncbi:MULTISPECIES: polysaccharide pyruvyl transferase family protein [unclassified Natrinema]|uniref:polysaccharide pyruvyl transferase family protein n=1 Tax=unclassified Natrinema TaxID=2622230 RepID=UPI0018CBDB81|nr:MULTISPECIES: polysaccharide pyruvyl transferase family protein [unclassified Natrinema]